MFAWLEDESEGEAKSSVNFYRFKSADNFYDENGKSNKSNIGHHVSIAIGETRTVLIEGYDPALHEIKIANSKVALTNNPVLVDINKLLYSIEFSAIRTGNDLIEVFNKGTTIKVSELNIHSYNKTAISGGDIILINQSITPNSMSIVNRANYLYKPLAVEVSLNSVVNSVTHYDVNGSNKLDIFLNVGINSIDNTELNVIRTAKGSDFKWQDMIIVDKEMIGAWKISKPIASGSKSFYVDDYTLLEAGKSYKINDAKGSNSESITIDERLSVYKMKFPISSGSINQNLNSVTIKNNEIEVAIEIKPDDNTITLKGGKELIFEDSKLLSWFPLIDVYKNIITYELEDASGKKESIIFNSAAISDPTDPNKFSITLKSKIKTLFPIGSKLIISIPSTANVNNGDAEFSINTYGKRILIYTQLNNKEISFLGHEAMKIKLGTNSTTPDGYLITTKSSFSKAHPITDFIIIDNSGSVGKTAGYSADHQSNRPTFSTSSVLSGITLNDNAIAYIYTHENAHGFNLDDVNTSGNVMNYSLVNSEIQKNEVNSFYYRSIATVVTATTTPKGNQNQWDDFKR